MRSEEEIREQIEVEEQMLRFLNRAEEFKLYEFHKGRLDAYKWILKED